MGLLIVLAIYVPGFFLTFLAKWFITAQDDWQISNWEVLKLSSSYAVVWPWHIPEAILELKKRARL